MTETQLRKTPLPEFDVEQEVDFGRYGRAIAAHWWLVSVGVLAGIVIGLLVTLGGSSFFKAEAIVYLGQPLAPGGGSPLIGPGTNPRIVDQIVRSEAVIREVAGKSGLSRRELRGRIGTRSLQGAVPRAGQAQLYAISVKGPRARKVEAAANAFAVAVINRVSGYVDVKREQLRQRLAFLERELDNAVGRLASITSQQNEVVRDRGLDVASKLILINNFNTQITALETRRANLEESRFSVRQFVKLADDIERARILTKAQAVSSNARSRRNTVLVGALIGLILGALAAILWEPVTQRFANRPTQ
jgi:uncharacterized protein involved in exopolysaccharide biosynthesis